MKSVDSKRRTISNLGMPPHTSKKFNEIAPNSPGKSSGYRSPIFSKGRESPLDKCDTVVEEPSDNEGDVPTKKDGGGNYYAPKKSST